MDPLEVTGQAVAHTPGLQVALKFTKNWKEKMVAWHLLSAEIIEPSNMRFLMKQVSGNDVNLVVGTVVTGSTHFESK